MKESDSLIFDARASRAGYVVFGVLYSPMFAAFAYGLFNGRVRGQEYALIFPLLLLALTYGPLLGFRIRITEDSLEYRDGFWRWHSCLRHAVRGCEDCWLEFPKFGRALKLPRMVIHCKGGSEDRIVINPKPFSRETIKRVKEILNAVDR